jgi:hypothetical protein
MRYLLRLYLLLFFLAACGNLRTPPDKAQNADSLTFTEDSTAQTDGSFSYGSDSTKSYAEPPPPPPPVETPLPEQGKSQSEYLREHSATTTSHRHIYRMPASDGHSATTTETTGAGPTTIVNEEEIRPGLLDYNIPSQMTITHAYTIAFAINRDSTDKSIIVPGDSHVVISTTPIMQVELIDPLPEKEKAFDISIANTEKIQMVDMQGHTDWNYTVVPLKAGSHKLNVVVSIIRGDHKKQKVYSSAVIVETDIPIIVKSWLEKNWQWVITTLLLPFGIWLWKEKHAKNSV